MLHLEGELVDEAVLVEEELELLGARDVAVALDRVRDKPIIKSAVVENEVVVGLVGVDNLGLLRHHWELPGKWVLLKGLGKEGVIVKVRRRGH